MEVDCFLVDLFWALQILYQASFRFSLSLCLKFRISFSGDKGVYKGLAMMAHGTQKASEKEANGKRGRIKRQGWSGGEENERQMANNVMRGIRVCDGYLVCIDLSVDLPGNGARNPSCYLLSTALVFPWEERVMQQSSVSISLSFWEPRYQSSRRLQANPLVPAQTNNNPATNAIKGLSIPSQPLAKVRSDRDNNINIFGIFMI